MKISRQAWYQGCQRVQRKSEQACRITEEVKNIRMQQLCLGTRKLHHILNSRDDPVLHIGRDSLSTILRHAGLLVRPARAYHKTTHSHHHFYKHPNLLKDGPEQAVITGPEQIWVADITWLPVRAGTAYVSLVTDAFSRKIVGYHVHESLHTEHVVKALQMALRNRRGMTPLIHHSDRGIQYCSALYQSLHERHGLICSMTDGYDCYQNAVAERVNGILKNELLITRPADLVQAEKMVAESVKIYNGQRPNLSLKYKTPDEVHQAF